MGARAKRSRVSSTKRDRRRRVHGNPEYGGVLVWSGLQSHGDVPPGPRHQTRSAATGSCGVEPSGSPWQAGHVVRDCRSTASNGAVRRCPPSFTMVAAEKTVRVVGLLGADQRKGQSVGAVAHGDGGYLGLLAACQQGIVCRQVKCGSCWARPQPNSMSRKALCSPQRRHRRSGPTTRLAPPAPRDRSSRWSFTSSPSSSRRGTSSDQGSRR